MTVRHTIFASALFLSLGSASSEADLAESVRESLATCELAAGSRVTVSASGGVVTLGGHVRTLRERECVAVEAERVPGVRFLQPRIAVRPAEPVRDSELVERVRGALRGRADFEGPAPLTVSADQGRITLGGEVRVPDDKYRASDAVSRVEGVLALENGVRVDPQQGLRSMEVELLELFRVRKVPVDDLRFVLEEGRVVIAGRSHDVVARSLVEEFTRQLPGGRLVATRIHLVLSGEAPDDGS